MADEAVPLETRACPEPGCDYEVTGPAKGKGHVAWRIASHRAQRHGYRNPNARKKARKPRTEDRPLLLGAVVDAAEEFEERKTSPPTIDELNRAGSRLIATLSVGMASYAAETDPTAVTDADRDAIVEYLAVSPEAAKEISFPPARSFGRSRLNKRYGRTVVDNVDAASAATEVLLNSLRWRRYLRERSRREAAIAAAQGPPPAAPVVPPPPPSSGPPPGARTEMAGVVMTPDLVRANGQRAGAPVVPIREETR